MEGSSPPIRVLIVDDQRLVRTGLRVIVEQAGDLEVVGEAADGAEAIALAARRSPQVVLMDIRMPVLDGLAATRRLLEANESGVAVIVLTTFDADENVFEALRAGASGFLLKDTPEQQLIEAIIAPAVTKRLIERFAQTAPVDAREDRAAVAELSAREREVLREVARGRS